MINLVCIIDWKWCVIIEKLKIRRALFGGYDQISVYKQLEVLNHEYQLMLEEERIKFEAILEEKEKEIDLLEGKSNSLNGKLKK